MERINLLLVDDEEEFVRALADRLKMRNIDSLTAHNGQQALDSLEQKKPDVMVLDLRMPGMDGMEVLRQVKAGHPDVEVIMLTGHGTEKDEERLRNLGAFDYLEKPTGVDKLAARIKAACARRLRRLENEMAAAGLSEEGDSTGAREILELDV